MKITITDKKPAGGKYVHVLLSDKFTVNRFVVKGKQEYLEFKVAQEKEMTRRKWMILVRSIVRYAKKYEIDRVMFEWDELAMYDMMGDDLGRVFTEAVHMANYEFRTYKKTPEKDWKDVKEILVVAAKVDVASLRKEVATGQMTAEAVNTCRNLANTPGEDMTPPILVAETKKLIKGTGIRMKVLGESQMKKEKMGGVLAVGKGSAEESQFLVLEYKGDTKKTAPPIVLVGKGVTFDTGGIDTKPHPHALDMMMDMSGAAAVISTIVAAAKLGVKKNAVVLVPAVENMPGGASMRPGDIITMMDGTTVEVGHTDAEGRIILADALTYAAKYKPETVIDVATLTGAAMVALGQRATAVFTRDDVLAAQTTRVAEHVGDYAWRLPLWEEYEGEIKGTHADIANIKTKGPGGYGGSITAAVFLHHFAKDYTSWMHLDMAPTMTAVYDEELAKGAKGSPVRLLLGLLEE